MVRAFFRSGGWLVIVFGLASAWAAALWLDATATTHALAARGVETKAVVEQLRKQEYVAQTDEGNRVRSRYSVTYSYDVPSARGAQLPQRTEINVSARVYRQLSIGEEVEIIYLPDDPSRSDLVLGAAERSNLLLGWYSSVLTVFALVSAVFTVLEMREERGSIPPNG